MNKKRNLPAVVQTEENEALFFSALNARAEANRRGAELAQTQLALVHSEMLRAEEKRTARREMDGLVGFVSVFACLLAASVCWIAAPWWTAVAPLVLMVSVMRKAGWV